MPDLETRLRRHADSALAAAPPVRLEEVLRPPAPKRPVGHRWVGPLAVAAAVLAVLGVAAALDGRPDQTRVAAGQSFPLTLEGHRDWTVALLNDDIHPTHDEVRSRYSESFTAAIPPDRFLAGMAPLQELAPWRVMAEVDRAAEWVAVQLEDASGGQVRLTVHVDPDGRADGSTLLRAVPCAPLSASSTSLSPPLQAQSDWIRELLASDRMPSDEELRQHFAPSFLAAIPPDAFRQGLVKIRAMGPFTRRGYEGAPDQGGFVERLGVRTGEEARYDLTIEPRAPYRIVGFSIRTQQPCRL